MENKKFKLGKLVLLEEFPVEKIVRPTYVYYKAVGKYRCFCGNEFTSLCNNVRKGKTKSCGCFKEHTTGLVNYKHGGSNSSLNNVYKTMKQRCLCPTAPAYKNYGGRGITICEEWISNFIPFKNWALTNGYKEGLTLDRKDNDLGYFPDNCRWVTMKIQSINQRKRKSNRQFTGVEKKNKKFQASLSVDGLSKYLGVYDTAEEASEVYRKAKKERDERYYKEEKIV